MLEDQSAWPLVFSMFGSIFTITAYELSARKVFESDVADFLLAILGISGTLIVLMMLQYVVDDLQEFYSYFVLVAFTSLYINRKITN